MKSSIGCHQSLDPLKGAWECIGQIVPCINVGGRDNLQNTRFQPSRGTAEVIAPSGFNAHFAFISRALSMRGAVVRGNMDALAFRAPPKPAGRAFVLLTNTYHGSQLIGLSNNIGSGKVFLRKTIK